MGFLSKDVGIDLGTANTLVYMKGKGIIMREPSVVAVDTKTDEVRCVGGEAKAVIGRTPGSIVAVRPLKDGVIADFDITTNMLENFLKKACGNSMFSRPRVVICIPSGVTEVERRAVREATLKAGARQVSVIEEPMAAAIGAGLPISEPTGSMIVDIGGGTAEIAVISLGGIVASRSVRMAGDMFDQAIIAFIKRKYNLLIGERTAEQIKIEIGSAYPMDPEMTMEIKGRNLVDGLPKNIVVHSEDVREALLECLVKITSAIKETLERTPPELSADIIDHGITLTGGGALLRGLDQLIQTPQQGTAAGQGDAVVDDIGAQLRRGALQGLLDGAGDLDQALQQGLAHILRVDDNVLGQAVHQVAALDLHGHLGVHGVGRADLDLDLLGGTLTDEQVILALDESDDGLIEHITGHPDAAGGHDAAQRDDCDLSGAAADVHDHAAGGLADGQARTDGSGHGLLDHRHLTGTSLQGSFPHGAALHLGHAGGNADDHAGAGEHAVAAGLLQEVLQHIGGDVKIGNDAVLQGAHCHDAAGGTADDGLCLAAHTAHLVGLGVHSHHRRLPHDDALALHIDQSIGGTQVNANVLRQKTHCKVSPSSFPVDLSHSV